MPKSFADDGAAGAFGSGSSPTGAIPGVTMSDPGPAPTGGAAPATASNMQPWSSTSFQSEGERAWNNTGENYSSDGSINGLGAGKSTIAPDGSVYTNTGQKSGGYLLANGGAIEDDTDGSPEQDTISKALSSVDAVLAFGRKLHGLGGGDNEGAINTAGNMPTIPGNQSETPGPYQPGQPRPQQMAQASYQNNRMPMRPGSQSESGVQPIQPAPGPLPPTNNPFGKRADAGDSDSDDQSGAIDTDEDTA